MSLVAERPPKVAVGFNPSAAAEPSRPTISSRSDDRTIATRSAIHFIRAATPAFNRRSSTNHSCAIAPPRRMGGNQRRPSNVAPRRTASRRAAARTSRGSRPHADARQAASSHRHSLPGPPRPPVGRDGSNARGLQETAPPPASPQIRPRAVDHIAVDNWTCPCRGQQAAPRASPQCSGRRVIWR